MASASSPACLELENGERSTSFKERSTRSGRSCRFSNAEKRASRNSKDMMQHWKPNGTVLHPEIPSVKSSEPELHSCNGARRPSLSGGESEYKDKMVQSIARQVEAYSATHTADGERKALIPIDPRTNHWLGGWDATMTIALVFTAMVTPVEVGFMEQPEDRWIDPLFLINRLVDIVFILDMFLQFVLMYPAGTSSAGSGAVGSYWEGDLRRIAKHYVLSWWFYLDAFSIGISAFDVAFDDENGSGASSIKAFRAVRVLRLLKLVRLLRGSRIFRRWEMRLSINYGLMSIANICLMLIFVCHLFACIWGLQASFDPLGTWLGAKGYCVPMVNISIGDCPKDSQCNFPEGIMCVSAGRQYLYSLYWSIATVTSIGYGDIVATPLHTIEQLICVCMMLTGSLLFAYLVGSFCGLAANLSPDVVSFRQDLTDLNKFLTANNIPYALRYQLREYMHQTVYLRRAATGNRLLVELAPKLRNEVALTINEKWLSKIDLINDECEQGLVLELAFALTLQIYPPGDSCGIGAIYIVSRGAALFAGRAYVAGTSWGEADALLTTDRLRFPIPASAITYLFAYSITGEIIRHTMAQIKYPDAAFRLRRKQVQWIVRRGVVRLAEEHLEKNGGFGQRKSGSRMSVCRRSICCSHFRHSKMANVIAAAAAAAREQPGATSKIKPQRCSQDLRRCSASLRRCSQDSGSFQKKSEKRCSSQMSSRERTLSSRLSAGPSVDSLDVDILSAAVAAADNRPPSGELPPMAPSGQGALVSATTPSPSPPQKQHLANGVGTSGASPGHRPAIGMNSVSTADASLSTAFRARQASTQLSPERGAFRGRQVSQCGGRFSAPRQVSQCGGTSIAASLSGEANHASLNGAAGAVDPANSALMAKMDDDIGRIQRDLHEVREEQKKDSREIRQMLQMLLHCAQLRQKGEREATELMPETRMEC